MVFDASKYLYSLQHFGVKLGLSRMEKLMSVLGDPHASFATVHVAGTNGKGSVCAMLASVLKAAGFKVGLYTSPHLVKFNERISVVGEAISEEDLSSITLSIKERFNDSKITFFEFTTAVAFEYFAREGVDIAIIEVGLGGRLDATNVIKPIVSVITNIDLDHTKVLGETRSEIAFEKGGIIKSGVPVVCGERNTEIISLFEKICSERRSEIFSVDYNYSILSSTIHEQKFSYGGLEFKLSLLGEHQIGNACIVLKVLELLRSKGFNVSKEAIDVGFAAVKWPGRLQVLSEKPLVMLDGAHNPAGMAKLEEFLSEKLFAETPFDKLDEEKAKNPAFDRKNVCVIGISTGKDVEWIFEKISEYFQSVIITEASHRAIAKEELAEVADYYFTGIEISEIGSALDLAKEKVGADGFVLVTGSLYVIGDVLAGIEGKM